ncbi:MAG: M12 family metallo-peptidase [Phycisphaerales bacterium]
MLSISLAALLGAAVPQPTSVAIDSPFVVEASAVPGVAVLTERQDWHAALQGAESVVIAEFPLGVELGVTLDLERRRVLAEDADLRLNEDGSFAASDAVMFGGTVPGEPGSLAFLAFSSEMTLGFIQTGGAQYVISSGPVGAGRPTVVYDLAEVAGESITLADLACQVLDVPGVGFSEAEGSGRLVMRGETPCRVADVAIETDTEFRTALFSGNATAAADYATFLVGAVSEIYERDLNVRLRISFLRIWTTTDPWNQNGGTVDQLFQFRDYWENNMGAEQRHGAHFLSGRPLGGGVAWLGAMCNPGFDYALSANLNGFFPYPLEDRNTQNWDLMVTAHEWGHNFGAPHTHQQSPFGNIDNCGNGSCSQLPGTIMSYCHLCGNGTGDVDLRFHPQNISSWMLSYLDGTGVWSGDGAQCDMTGDPDCDTPICLADTNGNGELDPGDFTAWVTAYNAGDVPTADQNGNGSLDPGDFTAWVTNYNAGCS